MRTLSIRAWRLCLAITVIFFALIMLNGYALNILGQPAHPVVLLALLALELFLLARYFRAQGMRVAVDPLELAGFLLVVFLVWLYFILPSLPTLLPPSYSGDAANHVAFAETIYSTGSIITDYPGGPALITATLAHWIGWLPVRLMHPLAAFWIALSAGGIYGLACAMLPDQRLNKVIALTAPAALYFIWNYFAGVLIGVNYFFTQVAAQFLIVALVVFLEAYTESPHSFWLGAMALGLTAIAVTFQLWLALPVALIAWELGRAFRHETRGSVIRAAAIVSSLLVFLGMGFVLLAPRFIPDLGRARSGGVTIEPTFQTLGGWFLVVPALGIGLTRQVSCRIRTGSTLLAFVLAQTMALGVGRLFGVSSYWFSKSFSLWVLPLSLLSVIPIHFILDKMHLLTSLDVPRHILRAFALVAIGLAALVWLIFPPPGFSPLSESDVELAVWVKNNLRTPNVNFIGTKTLAAFWIFRIWDETIVSDWIQDFVALGPKTFEEWRDDSTWGDYLFVSDGQHFNLDGGAKVVARRGNSLIAERVNPGRGKLPVASHGRFGDALALVEYTLPRQTLRAGETISATAQLETLSVPADQVKWRVQLRDQQNAPAAEIRRDPFENKFPFHRWPPGRILSQSFALPLSYDVRPGLYDLQVGLYQVSDGAPLSYVSADGAADDVMRLGRIKIALPPVPAPELASLTPARVEFGDTIRLLGYRAKNLSSLRPGDQFALDMYWQARSHLSEDYTVFVHLLDSSGALIAQTDSAPRMGTYPTSIWEAMEVVPDPYLLTIPSAAHGEEYSVEVGLYAWPSLVRLDAMDEQGTPLGEHFVLPIKVRVQQ